MSTHKLFITPSILRQLMHAYFPPELLQGMNLEESGLIGDQKLSDDGKKILVGILRTENKRLKLYGTAQSISVDLFLFRGFAASQEYVEMNWKENYGIRTPTYITDSERRHMTMPQHKFNQDIYAQLQATIYEALRGVKPEKYVVRVFNEGDMQLDSWTSIGKGQDHDFIMNAEMMQAVQAEGQAHNLMIDTGFLQTVPFDEMLCTKFGNVEFVLDIVPLTFCRARPIKMRNGGYCVLAYPSFRQMYHEVVYGIRAYERLSGETVEEFEKDLVKIFLDYYNVELAKRDHPPAEHNQRLYRYFITETKEKELKKRVYALCRRYQIDETIKIPAPVIHVREKTLVMDFFQENEMLETTRSGRRIEDDAIDVPPGMDVELHEEEPRPMIEELDEQEGALEEGVEEIAEVVAEVVVAEAVVAEVQVDPEVRRIIDELLERVVREVINVGAGGNGEENKENINPLYN